MNLYVMTVIRKLYKNFTNIKIENATAKPVVVVSGIAWGTPCNLV